MKLLLCRACQDIVKLGSGKFRKCACGKSSGRYLSDDWHAELKGENAVPICFLNTTLADAIVYQLISGGVGKEFIAFVAAKDHPTIKYVK